MPILGSSTHSQTLWSKIGLAEDRLTAASDRFWTHPDLAWMLPDFLVQLQCVMRSGLALMATARDRACGLAGDPVADATAVYLDAHIREEKDHDEWLLQDIESIGILPDEVLNATPGPAVVSLLGAQYFWLFYAHPVAIFGYLIVLEGYPPLAQQLDEIRIRTGFPESAFRCLKAHAEDDPGHIAMLNSTLDQMPLTGNQAKFIGLSALHTIDAVAAVFEQLIENCKVSRNLSRQYGQFSQNSHA